MRAILLLSSLLLGSAVISACSGAPGDSVGASEQATESVAPAPRPFVRIRSNGTGCPRNGFVGTLSADDAKLTIAARPSSAPPESDAGDGGAPDAEWEPVLSSMVEPGELSSVQDCVLGIDIQDPRRRSFAVESFRIQGYAFLDRRGMTAKQTAKFYFQGNPVTSTEYRSTVSGPYDNTVLLTDTIGVADRVWSSCTTERELNALLRSVVENNRTKTGAGYLEVVPTFELRLAWRTCG